MIRIACCFDVLYLIINPSFVFFENFYNLARHFHTNNNMLKNKKLTHILRYVLMFY